MRRKALLVGVNRYPDPAHELRGCVNDVFQVRDLLRDHFGFTDTTQVRMLLDQRATTAAIRERLAWLVRDSGPGDVLVFHYSGHGSQVRDRNGDEISDGLDETLCPYDFDWDDPFTDDELEACLEGLGKGAGLTVILDCCHSGTGLRVAPTRPLCPRCVTPPPDIAHRIPEVERERLEARLRRLGRRAAAHGAVLIAACRDDQVSADAYIDGDYHGAATYYLCRALAEGDYRLTYEQLIARTRRLLRDNLFEQVPQLEGPTEACGLPVFEPIVTAAIG